MPALPPVTRYTRPWRLGIELGANLDEGIFWLDKQLLIGLGGATWVCGMVNWNLRLTLSFFFHCQSSLDFFYL